MIGTRAQLIKMSPVMREFERRGWHFQLIMTGQHQETMDDLLTEFQIKTSPIMLHEKSEITRVGQMSWWFFRSFLVAIKNPGLFKRPQAKNILLIHGDTASTLLGSLVARWLGVSIGHIEAGLRSGNLLHPFPEEIIRRLVSKLADIGFCAGTWASQNLKSHRLKIIDTHQNTLIEAVQFALNKAQGNSMPHPYGVVSIHRYENIFFKHRFQHIIKLIEIAALDTPLVFVLHPTTRKQLEKYDLLNKLIENKNITLSERYGYVDFLNLLSHSKFVITDGGSNQEELSYLGIPTLLMRQATERQEGLNTTVTISHFDINRLQHFLTHIQDKIFTPIPSFNPSEIIANTLEEYL